MRKRSWLRKVSAAEEKYSNDLERLRLQEERADELSKDIDKLEYKAKEMRKANDLEQISKKKQELDGLQ